MNTTILALLQTLAEEGELALTENSQMAYHGILLLPEGDETADAEAWQASLFNSHGFSEPNEYGARMLEGIEEYRQELRSAGFGHLADYLPQWYHVPPASMRNAADVSAWTETFPDWDEQQIMNASENVRRASLPGFKRIVRASFRFEPEEKATPWGTRISWVPQEVIPNHRALHVAYAMRAESEAALHAGIVAEMKGRVDELKDPRAFALVTRG